MMKLFQKLQNRRGMMLAEVLTVVAIMLILLGIAMPNLLAESQEIEMAALNGNARAVAVAVQSELYGMKNKGTASYSEYYALTENAATKVEEVKTADGPKEAYIVSNFGEKGAEGKKYLLSGAITDVELVQKGKIVVVYSYDTADILEVFYSEKEFPAAGNGNLFPTAIESYLTQNKIGLYRGDPQPDLERNIGLPDFTAVWQYDDEMYLELQTVGDPASELLSKNLGVEVYAEIPAGTGEGETEEVLIYAEGMFEFYHAGTIQPDYERLTVGDVVENVVTGEDGTQKKGILRFAFDSIVTDKANYGGMKSCLRHQNYPGVNYITMASEVLYPRESVSNWFNKSVNPYLEYWAKRDRITAQDNNAYSRIEHSASALKFIDVDESFSLHVKLYILSDEPTTLKDGSGTDFAIIHEADENYGSRDIYSENASPYFWALSTDHNTVTLTSLRDLNNLKYVFEDKNDITKAILSHDIDGQQLYDKYIKVNKALKALGSGWGFGGDHDSTGIDSIHFQNKTGFTLSGKKPDSEGGGSYKIKSLQLGGRASDPGGLFEYAYNCTFADLDIVNPKIWRNGRDRGKFLQTGGADPTQITGVNVSYGTVPSGALVGVAVDCTFTNVRTYLAQEEALKVTTNGETYGPFGLTNYRISGTVCGGLVGIAIGEESHPTKFTNCAASSLLSTEFYYNASDCIYAGGLVGIAMGSVTIEDSYAASELTGYYAGGLVGAVASGNWNINYYDQRTGTATGNLKITDSFAAGIVMPLVRVGGGLIASIPKNLKNNVEVSGCYSAVQWKILPPVAYGTFEGDTANCYLYPTKFDLPVTANVLARFTCEGDVFSQRKDASDALIRSGVPCSAPMLKTKFSGWSSAASTTAWSWAERVQSNPTDTYPFPMPKGNDKFWGEWLRSYDSASETAVPAFNQKSFDGYYAAYDPLLGEYGRQYDAGNIQTNLGITLTNDGKITVGGKALKADGATYEEDNSYYWAKDVIYNGTLLGQGIDGATKITPSATSGCIDFTSAKYYSDQYDPIKGSTFLPVADGVEDESNYSSLPLLWDFYGFYFLANYPNEELIKYYIAYSDHYTETIVLETDKDGKPTKTETREVDIPSVEAGTAKKSGYTYLSGDGFHNFKKIVVNEAEFKAAVGLDKPLTLPATDAALKWDGEKGFHVE